MMVTSVPTGQNETFLFGPHSMCCYATLNVRAGCINTGVGQVLRIACARICQGLGCMDLEGRGQGNATYT
jgi:hypothetical protein